ncbi:uncharacterized protein [Cicer arietinum]|uniref:Uncharacterized protein LOC101500747 n=1 Tax=Cicer arietinum TaxID=3827 RepID=A0A1S2Y2F7_CICAR|nr:uncharacterized protein LOC101500747 [Cicer arietinum]XP_004497412.1 uncharacterized protein LOC101500747 [Cicer arietinum]XP_004517126.1 uncharacterized protein LOC101511882 [Cicer arietinum]XP_004517127.1 uncharacterized protein LOC101511882 [Cicer arietinum]
MLQSQCQHLLFSNPIPLLTHHRNHSLPYLRKPTSFSISVIPPSTSSLTWFTHLAELTTTTIPETDGPIELPFSSTPSLLSFTDDPSPIQVASSVLLTGAISVLLFRSLRRRAKRLKQTQFRSSGEKSVKEEALDTLKAMRSASIDAKGSPSPVQAFLGAISAGVISLILYRFASTIEAALNRQSISDDFSARQITITVRTIINGLTYLATFIFGLNSLGLFLYSGQLAIKSFTGESTEKETENKSADQSSLSNLSVETRTNDTELSSTNEEQSSNDSQ